MEEEAKEEKKTIDEIKDENFETPKRGQKATVRKNELSENKKKYFGDRFPEELNQNLNDKSWQYQKDDILRKRDDQMWWVCSLKAVEAKVGVRRKSATTDSRSKQK